MKIVHITEVKERVFATMREQRSVHPDDKRAIGHFDLIRSSLVG